jgi:NAD(P)-dependent dehydrogenase (short-subunit alcohol dehydrogenase family)
VTAPGPRLAGQAALVAGGSRGIGRAIALALAREGAGVAALARGRAGLDAVVAEIEGKGGAALAIAGDAAEEATAPAAVARTLARFGRLDVLVTAQGTGRFGPVEDSRLADWEAMMQGNLRATYLLCRAALAPMLAAGRGTMINVISLAAVRTIPGCAAYTASKAGALGFTRVLAEEVRGRGVRVAALCPGAVDTPFWDSIASPPDRSRMLRPEAVADAALLVALQPAGALVEEVILAPTPGIL